jgi:hypothetical protein|tara:strand:- start:240 stop:362 length:123 start_codon:yes stop_codon:yes gene_type:complete
MSSYLLLPLLSERGEKYEKLKNKTKTLHCANIQFYMMVKY